VALFRSMAALTTNPTLKRTVVLTALLLAVMTSGLSQVEIHSHPDAYLGHSHDVHGNDEPDNEHSADQDEPGNIAVTHMHDTGTTPMTLVSAINVDTVTHWRAEGGVSTPISKPPDNIIPPLYRPPIV